MSFSRRWIYLVLCLVPALAGWGDVSPQRLLLLRGVIALEEHQGPPAVADLHEAAALQPLDWQAQMFYGEALLNTGESVLARGQLRRATLLAPAQREPWQALSRAGQVLDDPQLELAGLAGELRCLPEDPAVLRRLAEVYRATRQEKAAEKVRATWEALLPPKRFDAAVQFNGQPQTPAGLRQLAHDNPTLPIIYSVLATAEWKQGNLAACRDALRAQVNLTPQDAVAVRNYAHLCLLTDQVDDALNAMEEAAPLGDVALDRALALWSLSTRQYARAIPPLQRLLMRAPVDEVLNRQLGLALWMTGETEDALAALRLAWLRGHHHLTAQLYADVLLRAGQPAQAEDLLKRALLQSPDESLLRVQLAALYRDTARLPLAAQSLADLAKVRPEAVELHYLAGVLFWQAGQNERALSEARLLRDAYAGDLTAAHASVTLFRMLGNFPAARLVFTRYLGPTVTAPLSGTAVLIEIARDAMEENRLDEAQRALEETLRQADPPRQGYVLLGTIFAQQEDWPAAIRLYHTALARWPQDPAFSLALARVARTTGNYALAIRSYQQAAQGLSTPEPWLELGEVYHLQGEETLARQCWTTAGLQAGGAVRAQMSLLASYERVGETEDAQRTRTVLLRLLQRERTRRSESWRMLLGARGVAPTEEELQALLLLQPDMFDPATLEKPAESPQDTP